MQRIMLDHKIRHGGTCFVDCDQEGIIDNSFTGIWPLQIPFTWCIQHTPNSQSPPCEPNPDLDNLLHPPQRDIYVGPRMTKAAEARWQGNTQEIKVGMLIAHLQMRMT